jgi:hypothetical protein
MAKAVLLYTQDLELKNLAQADPEASNAIRVRPSPTGYASRANMHQPICRNPFAANPCSCGASLCS